MYIFLSILTIIVSIVLILVVLVQNSKGGGLSSNFSSSNQIMGAPKTADFLEKLTWSLIGVVFVLSLISAKLIITKTNDQQPATELSTPSGNTEIPNVSDQSSSQPKSESEQIPSSQLPPIK